MSPCGARCRWLAVWEIYSQSDQVAGDEGTVTAELWVERSRNKVGAQFARFKHLAGQYVLIY